MTHFERNARAFIASRGSADTRKLYTADLESWLRLCDEEDHDPNKPSLEAATSFRDELLETKAPATVRRTLSAICSMYKSHGLPRNPFEAARLERPPADEVALTREYTREETDALLRVIEEEAKQSPIGRRDYAIVRALYDTGMRVSTACAMEREALHTVDGEQYLVTTVKKKGRVEIALPAETSAAINLWLANASPSKWVFPALRGHVKRGAINARLLIYGKRAGVENAAPHRFRASYITEALDAGVSLRELQASVHHADPKTTLRYDRGVRGAGVASAVAKFRSTRK